MKQTHTHPMAEKLQVKFQNQDSNPGEAREVGKTISVFNRRADSAGLQHEFEMHEEAYDVQREFKIQYEQFIVNISDHPTKHTHS